MGFQQDVNEVVAAANAAASRWKISAGVLLIVAVAEAIVILFLLKVL